MLPTDPPKSSEWQTWGNPILSSEQSCVSFSKLVEGLPICIVAALRFAPSSSPISPLVHHKLNLTQSQLKLRNANRVPVVLHTDVQHLLYKQVVRRLVDAAFSFYFPLGKYLPFSYMLNTMLSAQCSYQTIVSVR